MDSRKPYISVIIPTSNRREYLELVLIALDRQINKDFEVIIIDDGSNDGTKELIENRHSFYPINYYALTKIKGTGAGYARNKGIELAQGEVVVFLDSDSLVRTDFIAQHNRVHRIQPGLVVVGIRWQMQKSEITYELIKNGISRNTLPVKNIEKQNRVFSIFSQNLGQYILPWWFFSTSNASVRRQDAVDAGMFDEEFCSYILYEDTEFAYRLFRNNLSFILNSDTECFHMYHHVDEAQKYELAKGNIRYFQEKYPGVPEIEHLDTLLGTTLEEKKEERIWIEYLIKVNKSKKISAPVVKKEELIVVKDSWNELGAYLDILNKKEANSLRVVVIDCGSKDNSDVFIQLYPFSGKLLYYRLNECTVEDAIDFGRKMISKKNYTIKVMVR